MRKITSALISLLTVITLAGCQTNDTPVSHLSSSPSEISPASQSTIVSDAPVSSPDSDLFDVTAYEEEDLYDMYAIELPEKLAAVCKSYQFIYKTSDNVSVKGYLSIPTSAIKAQKPWKCILLNRGGNSSIGLLSDTATSYMCAMTDRIVIASQYRGSDGSEGKDQFGGDDLNDVLTLIDLCEKRF